MSEEKDIIITGIEGSEENPQEKSEKEKKSFQPNKEFKLARQLEKTQQELEALKTSNEQAYAKLVQSLEDSKKFSRALAKAGLTDEQQDFVEDYVKKTGDSLEDVLNDEAIKLKLEIIKSKNTSQVDIPQLGADATIADKVSYHIKNGTMPSVNDVELFKEYSKAMGV